MLGVLGSGQLGKMFAMAAARLGYRVHVYAPEHDAPAADVAYRQTIGAFDDEAAVAEFARSVDVVTLEFENISAAATEAAARFAPVRPGGRVLHTTQQRLREKGFLKAAGIPCTPFAEATTKEQLAAALAELGTPAVLKTAAWGYDGKGQSIVRSVAEAEAAHAALGGAPAILEGWVDFECEVSMLAARNVQGEEAFFGPIANDHAHHILDVSVYPRPEVAKLFDDGARNRPRRGAGTRRGRSALRGVLPHSRRQAAGERNRPAAAQLGAPYDRRLRVLAVRAAGAGCLRTAAGVVRNARAGGGDGESAGGRLAEGEPRWTRVLADPRLRLHLYGKAEARPGRKMGHLTALAGTAEEAANLVRAARESLVVR